MNPFIDANHLLTPLDLLDDPIDGEGGTNTPATSYLPLLPEY